MKNTAASSGLFDLMIRKGYPKEFASVVAEEMRTEYTSERMTVYISRNPLLSPQEVADEMLSILSDRDSLIQKHMARCAQDKINQMYNSSLPGETEDTDEQM